MWYLSEPKTPLCLRQAWSEHTANAELAKTWHLKLSSSLVNPNPTVIHKTNTVWAKPSLKEREKSVIVIQWCQQKERTTNDEWTTNSLTDGWWWWWRIHYLSNHSHHHHSFSSRPPRPSVASSMVVVMKWWWWWWGQSGMMKEEDMWIHHHHIAQSCWHLTPSVQCSQMRMEKTKSNKKWNKEGDLLFTIQHSKSYSSLTLLALTPSNKIMILHQSTIIIPRYIINVVGLGW